MDRAETAAQICRRRKQCIVHRYLYYVLTETLIDDFMYDMLERDLRVLVEENPELAESLPYAEDCPTKHPGSSNLWDYPRELQYLAESLLKWTKEHPAGKPSPDLLNVEEPAPLDMTIDLIDDGSQPRLFG